MGPHGVSEIVAFVVAAAAILLIPVCLTYIVVLEMLFFRLRRKHPDHYEKIGSPSVFLNNSISKSNSMVRYVLDRDYLAVPDERAIRLGDRSRRLFHACTVLFVTTILGFLVLGLLLA